MFTNDNGEAIDDWRVFANKVEIPQMTFYRYIKPDSSKRLKLGDGSWGKKKLLTESDINSLVQF